jgi:hypothetical protein
MTDNPFIKPETVATYETFNGRLFPLPRAKALEDKYSELFSAYLGAMRSGRHYEPDVLVVSGESGSGKTAEIEALKENFNHYKTPLPNGTTAKMVTKELDRKGGWKALGSKTLKTMNYPLADNSRMNQTALWDRVALQGKLQGIVAINYDEMQHILSGKEGDALAEIIDSFKSIVKSKIWPFVLVLSGVPELDTYLPAFEQIFRKVEHLTFQDLHFDTESVVVHDIVSSYALTARLEIDADLHSTDFIHRLATAAAFRWGLVCYITLKAVAIASKSHSGRLSREHFVDMWVAKTEMNRAATPFTHSGYSTVFRKNAPFWASVPT